MKTESALYGILAMLLAAPFAVFTAAQSSPAGEKPKRAADEQWNPPRAAHIGGNDFSTFCVHDGKDTAFVIAYHGDFDSTSRSSSNATARTWNNAVTLTAKKPSIALSFFRTHTAPGKLSITVTPAEGRDLSKPAPPPRDFGHKAYDLAKGRVFLLTDTGLVRQFDLPTPVVTDQESAQKLAKLIAAIPPQERVSLDAKPMHRDARELYEIWQRLARANGDIPGALVGELAAAVKQFIKYNPTWETVPQLNEILPRLDATHDWKSTGAIALLDEVAAVKDSPLSMASWKERPIRKGEALPKNFADVSWGETQPNGLRAAWVLEPGAVEHRIGAALKGRLLVQNTGSVPVVLQIPTFHQGWVKAIAAKGAEVRVSGISWTTIARLFPCRLGPGEYIEIYTPGVGIGPSPGMGPWAGPRVGSSVLAKPGDDITLTHSLVPLDGSEVGMSKDDPHVIGPGWWLAHMKKRLARELPLPTAAAERTRLLDRAVRELFATAPTAEETTAFVADKTPDAFEALANHLAARTDVVSFSGKLEAAPAKFRVLAADANADKQPRVVLGPGEYPLPSPTARRGDATLKIVGRPVGDRRMNDAQLLFEPTEFTGVRPPEPHKLEVPDGWGTWAIVCRPSDGFLYVLHKGGARKIDFTNPRKVTDTPATDLPAEFRDEVKRQLEIAGVSAEKQAELFEKPAPPATTPAPKTGASVPASDEAPLKPKHKYAQKLFRKWQANARTDGKIPGALIGHVAREIHNFVKRYPQDEKAPRLAALRPRLDASHDWTQAEVAAVFDDITAISTAPVSWAAIPMESSEVWTVRAGKPLPVELKSAAWGEPAENGLRAAWLLEPRAEQYSLGTVLKARVLFHNTGTKPVVFKTETWHQDDPHTARDAKGDVINVKDTFYTGETPMATYRLEPGEYVAFRGHGIGIGAGEYREERSTGSIGAWIEAKEGDEVSFSSLVDASREGWTGLDDPKDPIELWKLVVLKRVEREAPLPSNSADREQLIRRVVRDLFGESPTAEEIAAFATDNTLDALAKLTVRLQAKQRIEPFVGKLPTGEIKFRVLPADPNAVKVPDDQRVKAGFPADELVGEGVMWNDVQNGMSLGYRITGDEWRILGKEVKVELWVRNSGDKDVKFQTTARPDVGLRMKLKNETGVKGAKEREHESDIARSTSLVLAEHRLLPPGHALKVKEFSVSLLWPENDVSGITGHFFAIAPGAYKFHCELELPGFSGIGEGGRQFTPAAGEWTGRLTTRSRYVGVIAPDAPAPKPRIEHMDVGISKDGEVSLFRKKMALDELKTRTARNARKQFTISADEDVPYAKVVEVVEALKAAGVTEFSFAEARVGDGKYRAANRTGIYKFDDKHGFFICRPSGHPQWFTVNWPAEGERPACGLRTYPNVSGPTQGKWAVVWEPGTDVLWWVDDSDVGKMTFTDPMRVIVDREGRRNSFSRDFGLPDGVVTEFRRLGFEIGRDKTPGLENAIGGNTGGQSIVSAEFGAWSIQGRVTDADGKPLAKVPVRVATNRELKTEKTDAKGEYRAYFSLPLQLLAHWRGVSVEPVLEGFTERDMAKAGEFNVLLRAGEEPRRVRLADDTSFQPGPIPRFAARDLVPSQPGRADFVMLNAGEIIGDIVTADGRPAPPHWIAAAARGQRPGHNAAIELSDAQGHFRLKRIPTNKPVVFTVNPDGKPGETSKSREKTFDAASAHRIRLLLPQGGSGNGALEVERVATP